jgi:hypothetical protein
VLLDRPGNEVWLLVVNIGLALIFLAAAIKYKPYADATGNTSWTVADKTQVLQLLMLLVQHAMAALCMATTGDTNRSPPMGVQIVTTAAIIVTILLPFVYVLLLYHGRDPLACTRKPSTPTEGLPPSTVRPFDDAGGEDPLPLPHTGRRNRVGAPPSRRRVEVAASAKSVARLPDGWVERSHNGRPFFVNASTREKTWTRPTTGHVRLPDGRVEQSYRGEPVYINTRTQTRTRSHPDASQAAAAATLTHTQMSEAAEAFDIFDRNGSGNIDAGELTIAMKALGLNPSAAEVDVMLQRADTDSNGTLDLSEFIAMVALQTSSGDGPQFTSAWQSEQGQSWTQARRPTERVQHHVNPLAPPPALPSAGQMRQWRQEREMRSEERRR